MAAIKLTRAHRVLVGIVLTGAAIIAAIGFVGSYAAVRDLAERKGFGDFAPFFPIGVDAGIVVLLALDLLLTWLRIPFPLLRQCAWLLTAATIAFNGAAAWGDPLGVGMHAIIPVLFVITVEAARHAIGRVADITADRHMEGVRMWRWFLSPIPTFRLWRRMKLWELRSYEEVITMERDRLVYQAQLRAEYGRAWRRRAPVEARMPLKLARYGVPLRETAATGLAAARPRPAVEGQRPAPARGEVAAFAEGGPGRGVSSPFGREGAAEAHAAGPERRRGQAEAEAETEWGATGVPGPDLDAAGPEGPGAWPDAGPDFGADFEPGFEPGFESDVAPGPPEAGSGRRRAGQRADREGRVPAARPPGDGSGAAGVAEETVETVAVHGGPPVNGAARPGRSWREPAEPTQAAEPAQAPGPVEPVGAAAEFEPARSVESYAPPPEPAVTVPVGPGRRRALGNAPAVPFQQAAEVAQPSDGGPSSDAFYDAYRQYILEQGDFPNARQLSRFLHERFAITDSDGTLLSEQYLRPYTRGFRERYSAEMGTGV